MLGSGEGGGGVESSLLLSHYIPFLSPLSDSTSYFSNQTSWNDCKEPKNIALWNITLFSILLGLGCLEFLLCAIQIVSALFGVICGDCRKKGKVEKNQYLLDDTALNGIRIYCERKDSTSGNNPRQSADGSWGEWKPIRWCLRGFIVAFTLRVEEHKTVGDKTAVNNINVMCSKGEYLEGEGLIWGSYGAWSNRCDNGICGIQTKVQEKQGLLGDDTALNDVRFLCC
ncbi:vitelline membrane outer layer protein 1 homolog [Pelobates fuscus]|uniref:vitelline membrane outer layer protein 1 homolog n=1 Tax=Pelobates fuscus TaxID=191477 RepID=UPI002FE4A691